jgi:hypothetical protein
MLVRLLPLALVVAASCATPAAQMTVAEHERAADQHRATADAQEEQFDPRMAQTLYRAPSYGMPAFHGAPLAFTTVNPTLRHIYAAERQERLAVNEDQAAQTLLATAAEACAPFPMAVRTACPAVRVAGVERTMGGVKATLRGGDDGPALAARWQCHVAWADAFGEEDAGSCPLYQRGLRVEHKNGVLVLKAQKREQRAALYAFLSTAR